MELSIERVAQLQAEMDAGASVDEVLARVGVSREGYYLAKEAHLRAIADELRGGRRVLSSRYQQAFVKHRSVLAPTTAREVEPSPRSIAAPTPLSALAAPTHAPAPQLDPSPPRYQASFQRLGEPLASVPGFASTPAFASTPEAPTRGVAPVAPATDDDAVGETAHMSVPQGLAAAAAARDALPFAQGTPGAPPPAPPPAVATELPPQKRKAELSATVGLTDADEAQLRALLSTPFDAAAPKKKKKLLATVAVDDDAVGETAHMSVPQGLAAAAAARDALPFAKGPPPAPPPPAPPPPAPPPAPPPPAPPPSAEPVLPPIGQLVEMQAALARAADRDALLASRGFTPEAWQSILRRYGALMQSDPVLRARYESLLAQATAR